MKSFDDWYNSHETEDFPSLCQAFKAGQQSKQAEVDEMRKRIDEEISFAEDVHSENWQDCISCINNILNGDQL